MNYFVQLKYSFNGFRMRYMKLTRNKQQDTQRPIGGVLLGSAAQLGADVNFTDQQKNNADGVHHLSGQMPTCKKARWMGL
jgi:hypothetical protein